MDLDENQLPKEEIQKLINEAIEREASIFKMKYGVSKTSFYEMIPHSSTAYKNAIENLRESAGFYVAAKSSISLSGKADALQNYFECADDLAAAIEEVIND